MRTAVVCVSFGTAVPQARQENRRLEAALQGAVPESVFATAIASDVVRRRMAAQGQAADSVPQALEKLAAAGCRRVAVQPTHLLCGTEYDTMKAQLAPYMAQFDWLAAGEPLLAGAADLPLVAKALASAWPAVPGEALLLAGHGTGHAAANLYPALQAVLARQGRQDLFVGALQGEPALDRVLPQMRQAGCTRVHLVPLLLAAGAHARRDMAGQQPESWYNRLQAAGLEVRCTLRGLAGLPAIQQLYIQKLLRLLAS